MLCYASRNIHLRKFELKLVIYLYMYDFFVTKIWQHCGHRIFDCLVSSLIDCFFLFLCLVLSIRSSCSRWSSVVALCVFHTPSIIVNCFKNCVSLASAALSHTHFTIQLVVVEPNTKVVYISRDSNSIHCCSPECGSTPSSVGTTHPLAFFLGSRWSSRFLQILCGN